MHGRWLVQPAGKPVFGRPWLVLRAGEWQAVQRNGPVLELGTKSALAPGAGHHGRPARGRSHA
jgi:hypothetical protein